MDGLDELGLTGVLDVHSDQYAFLEEPVIAIPDKKEGKGRTATKYKTSSVYSGHVDPPFRDVDPPA